MTVGVVDASWRIERIVSGGQTGADRAALDFALERGIEHGGWCPRGRLAEDGVISVRYQLQETAEAAYSQRTEWNVRDSDATVIFSLSPELSGGSRITMEFARLLGKPWIHLCRSGGGDIDANRLSTFLAQHRALVMNVAGPRASEEPGIGAYVSAVLAGALLRQ